jgi:serine-type D-Ala-D-Ala carboxypeptidase/endopeptidase (penicillin-binding protein 4)
VTSGPTPCEQTPWSRRSVLGLLASAPIAGGGLLAGTGAAHAAPRDEQRPTNDPALASRIQRIIDRPEFAGSSWGMRFHLLDSDEPVYSMNPAQRFVAASAVKVFIAGSAFSALGPDHRFRTRVYRTGPVVRGVLRGHLVLVAGGDLLLGPRIQPDGTLALPHPDHSYGTATEPVPGDPLRSLRGLARQVAARGIRRVEGRVLVDASLFREGREEIANGFTPIPVSPMMVNDNIVDVVVTPADRPGVPATLRVSPRTAYVLVVNEVTTVAADAAGVRPLAFGAVASNPDGTHTVRLTGDIPVGRSVLRPYYVPDPVRFAEIAFAETLRDEGIGVESQSPGTAEATVDVASLASRCTARNRLAEHVSPPLSEQVKVMLKLSSNVHTVYFPYLVGAIAGRDPVDAEATGEQFRRRLLERAGLDPDEPGYTSDFFVQFLAYMARQRYFPAYRRAMPVMGRDGTLTGIAPDLPAAGHVHAKTGSAITTTRISKALAGYIRLPDRTSVAFAEFMTQPVGSFEQARELEAVAGQAHGEIVNAVYEALTR